MSVNWLCRFAGERARLDDIPSELRADAIEALSQRDTDDLGRPRYRVASQM